MTNEVSIKKRNTRMESMSTVNDRRVNRRLISSISRKREHNKENLRNN